jgi:hypothetical protein
MRRDPLDRFIDREMEQVLGDAGISCSGWESDPQSFSKRIAENFCQDAFNTKVSSPDSITCSGSACVVHYGGTFPFNVTVDLSQVPGIVTASGTAAPFAMRPKRCSYRYSCSFSGAVSFTRVSCKIL